jgi:hypothetical protein
MRQFGRAAARVITEKGLDLDDLGAVITQKLAGEWPSKHSGNIQNNNARQASCRELRRRTFLGRHGRGEQSPRPKGISPR